MSADASRRRTSSPPRTLVGAGLDTSEGRHFLPERLALFGKTIGWLALAFFLVLFALNLAVGSKPPLAYLLHRAQLWHLAGAAVMLHLWFAARRRKHSLAGLEALDAVSLIACCSSWAVMTDHDPESPLIVLFATSVTVIARAVIVPSSARRTLLLSLAAMAPVVVLSVIFAPTLVYRREKPVEIAMLIVGVNATLWSSTAVAIATLVSSVIYGLRKRVREATELGAYTLEERIGSGSMGEVWRARHRMLIRPAAVKLIRPHALGSTSGSSEVLLRRFEREARATAALRSPHTVQLYDFGVAADGTFYYVMELLDGFNLDQLVTRFGPQPAERVVHILYQVCCSLADAHRNGLIHRDIKPANIFVTRLKMAADFVKVVDFGLVKLVRHLGEPAAGSLTGAGTRVGTPAFMAPEAIVGAPESDHRADLYSLGCVAYWLLTGSLVFEGACLAVLIEQVRTPPPPPSTRVELPIPPALERLVLDCLEKDPAHRPQSAAELGERLQSIALAAPWTQERAEHWWNMHARDVGEARPAADLLLSHEARASRTFTDAAQP